jgi:hypothetical protein
MVIASTKSCWSRGRPNEAKSLPLEETFGTHHTGSPEEKKPSPIGVAHRRAGSRGPALARGLTDRLEIVEHCQTVTRLVGIVALLSLLSSFVTAPLTHEHATNGGLHAESFVHAHFSSHLNSSDSRSEIGHGEKGEIRYLDLFQAHPVSASVPYFVVTSAFRISSESSSYGVVVLVEPNAHAPPLVLSLPARSPPAHLISRI